MRNQLDVNGEGFELEGQWSTDGADRCFDGTVRRISSGDSMPVTCRIPLSAIRAHGERYHEEQCQISLKEDIATDFFCPLCDGAMISSSGFTPAGINYAKARGIDTFRLIDTESIDWKSYVSIPALVRSTNFKGFRVIFENFTILPMAIENSDIRALSLFSYDGTHLGSIGKIVAEKWNNDEIDDSPGEKDILIGRGVLLKLGEEIGMGRPVDVRAKVAVERNYFFGKLSVHLKGLKDLQKGGVITREFITDSIEPARIEQGLVEGWKKIDSEEQLSVRPVLDLSVKDYLPIEEISNIGAKES